MKNVENEEPPNKNIGVIEAPPLDESYDFKAYEISEELFCNAYCGDRKNLNTYIRPVNRRSKWELNM